jgi:acetyl/propionyl-CoA carboxylase alpha subunit
MIRKLLVANRGEIAVRIIRGARGMGIRTVAVHSDADADAQHTNLADEAVSIGASEPASSYLDIRKILAAAKTTGADAVHPGYGFLSERPEFAEACQQAGLIFVGPPASAMRRLGSKMEAKALAVASGVPVVPGHFEPGTSVEDLALAADEIGYPVMLKASAGGGGRGMRVVRDPARFHDELRTASDEALKAFGDGAMMVEKLVERPRHIEVQVLADSHGNVATLFERECSIQRRHQKLIEEAPSPYEAMPELWPEMREAARRLILESGYINAGTVEFIVDPLARKFYFLEVNARLQVEHPVTEAVTGLDLVQWQLRIAAGERLEVEPGLLQGDRSAIHGHSMEARIVAEDPAQNFLPSVGKLQAWAPPRVLGVRVDTGYGQGAIVPRFYDSLIAKVISHGESRAQAVSRLKEALRDFHILGVQTNIGYLLDVLEHPEFAAGNLDTGFLEREMPSRPDPRVPDELASLLLHSEASANRPEKAVGARHGAWDIADAFRVVRS